jgi:hypothetical protein
MFVRVETAIRRGIFMLNPFNCFLFKTLEEFQENFNQLLVRIDQRNQQIENDRNKVSNIAPSYQHDENEEEGIVDENGEPIDPTMRNQNQNTNQGTSTNYEITMEECNELLELLYDEDDV